VQLVVPVNEAGTGPAEADVEAVTARDSALDGARCSG
jgi:hypothetical protein